MKLGKVLLMFLILVSSLLPSVNHAAYAQEIQGIDKSGVPVLMYHHILKKGENKFKNNSAIINLEDFQAQMKYLKDNGYYTATLAELGSYLNGEISLPAKTIVITFDDGYKSVYLYAYPELKKYGFKAEAFIITNYLTDTPVPFNPDGLQFLSWPEMNEMKEVFQYGSHTAGLHWSTNGVPALLTEPVDVISKDLETSRSLLNTDYFCYPFGAYNQSTISLLKAAGYKFAFTTKEKNAKKGDNPYEIGRMGVYPSTSMQQFRKIVNSTGWVMDDGYWYYYDGNGVMITGWANVKNIWYYMDQNGKMKTGWQKWNNNWYYLDSSGAMKTGWLLWNNKWYYLDRSGSMKTGWLLWNNCWYYLDSSGAMQTGWVKDRNTWYYLNGSGTMEVGWKLIGGKWYYFYSSGKMAANTWIDGYKIGASGAWIN